ncbi:MAG: ATP-dependent helicase, partial [Candidatus Cryptobacteroides sp.]
SARIEKKCFSEGEDGEQIRLIQAYTEQEEALLIASAIMAKMRSDHAQYQDFAILYRTNSQSRALEEALRRRNMPYMIYSGNSFFERAEVKDVMAYFKLAANPGDDESFKRVVNKPARGIGDTSMNALIAAAVEKHIPLMKAAFCEDLENYGLRAAAVKKIRDFAMMMAGFSARVLNEDAHSLAVSLAADSGIYIMYKSDTSIEGQAKAANVEELLNGVKTFVEERHSEDFEQMQIDGDVEEGVEITAADLPVVTLADYLENVSLLSAADTAEGDDGEDVNNKISLMTVHSSKGLEFPYVFVAGMEENLFPSGGSLASEQDVEEERRLFYVAMTRAKKCLQLTFASSRMRNGKHENNSPSRFIREIDSRYISNPLQVKDFEGLPSVETSFGFRRTGEQHRQGDRFRQEDRYRSAGPSASSRPSAPQAISRPLSPTRPVSPSRPASSLPSADFVPSPILELRAGQRVEHNRFGLGKIISISGKSPADMKAVIEFDNFGQKILLLNYAKIRIVKE